MTNRIFQGITITSPPRTTSYSMNQKFNRAGMVVKALYSDGSLLPISNYTVEPVYLPYGTAYVTVKYGENGVESTARQDITVRSTIIAQIAPPVKLDYLTISTQPTKIQYFEGETFNPAGMVVTAVYTNNTSAVVTDYTYSPTTALTTDITSVTVSYSEEDITKTVNVPITVSAIELTGISVTTAPTKTSYFEGELFNATGMVITASYSNSTTATVTDYSYTPTTALTTDNTSIVVSYTEEGITKTASVTISVQAIELTGISVTTPPTRTSYTEGQSFDTSGMVVTASYNNGTTQVVTNYTYSPTGALTTDDMSITISYTEDSITKTVNINVIVEEVSIIPDGYKQVKWVQFQNCCCIFETPHTGNITYENSFPDFQNMKIIYEFEMEPNGPNQVYLTGYTSNGFKTYNKNQYIFNLNFYNSSSTKDTNLKLDYRIGFLVKNNSTGSVTNNCLNVMSVLLDKPDNNRYLLEIDNTYGTVDCNGILYEPDNYNNEWAVTANKYLKGDQRVQTGGIGAGVYLLAAVSSDSSGNSSLSGMTSFTYAPKIYGIHVIDTNLGETVHEYIPVINSSTQRAGLFDAICNKVVEANGTNETRYGE